MQIPALTFLHPKKEQISLRDGEDQSKTIITEKSASISYGVRYWEGSVEKLQIKTYLDLHRKVFQMTLLSRDGGVKAAQAIIHQ
jgi:hypothetical protein